MKTITIVPYRGLPCEAQEFTVNGTPADKSDFGSNTDTGWGEAEDYACGYNEFLAHDDVDSQVLSKYNITEAEYREIQSELTDTFRVGSCGWCV